LSFKRVAQVHNQDQSFQRGTFAQVLFNSITPLRPDLDRDFGIAVTGKIDQSALVVELKEIE